jgi:LPXTG-motif cell wall-anchored protein
MKRVTPGLLAAAAIFALAGAMMGQNADQNSAGPTKNTLRLRLVEPHEGSRITGSSIRVAVDFNRTLFGEGSGSKFGNANYPQPRFDVFLDNTLKETLKGGEKNVVDILNVPPGSHKVVVVAKNVSNEIIDRAEVSVTTVEATAAASDQTTSTGSSASASTSSSSYSSSASPASTASAPPAQERPRDTMTASTDRPVAAPRRKLPKTASPAPAAAAIGLGLLAAGAWVGRQRSL